MHLDIDVVMTTNQSITMETKGYLSDFKCDLVVGATQARLRILETAEVLGVFHKTICRIYRE